MSDWQTKRMVSGNSVTEYGLVLVLLVVAAMAALGLLGDNVNDLISGSAGTLSESTRALSDGEPVITAANGTIQVNSVGEDGLGRVTVRFANGERIVLHDYPVNAGKTIQSLGVNGTTVQMANQIKILTEAMVQHGEIDRQQAATLIALANQGHRMASIEAILEQGVEEASRSNMSATQYANQRFEFEGRQYSPAQLARMVGHHTGDIPLEYRHKHPNTGPEMQKLLDLYARAKEERAMANPAIRMLVTHLTHQIMDTGDGLEETINGWMIYPGADQGRDERGRYRWNWHNTDQLKDYLRHRTASNLTNQSSVGICYSGYGTDTNNQCR